MPGSKGRLLDKSMLRARIVPALFLFFVFCVLFHSSVLAAPVDPVRPYLSDTGQFDYARFLLGERDYREAAREFARLIEKFPASAHLPEAQFGLAEAYLASGLFKDAEDEFKLFVSNFPENRLVPEAREKADVAGGKAIARAMELLRERDAQRRSALKKRSSPVVAAMRAVQVSFFEAVTYSELEDELRAIKDSGIDTVIVRVFHNVDDRYYPFARPKSDRGVYFRTGSAPVVDDILADITRAAHDSGLKVFAWMTTRYADYGVEWNGRIACKGYDFYEEALFRCKGLDLFNEDAVRRLETIYSDLANYDIDGILFQDDLVLRHNEGFGVHAQALFRARTGRGFSPGALYVRPRGSGHVQYKRLFWEWASWKNRRLLHVADRLRDVVRVKRPKALFAINLMYESVTNPPGALAWLSQGLRSAVDGPGEGFDYYSIMAYHRQMERELNMDAAQIERMIKKMAKDAAREVGEPGRVLIKLQTVDWRTGEPLSDSELVRLIRGVKRTGGVGLALVPYRGDLPLYELTGEAPGFASLRRTGVVR